MKDESLVKYLTGDINDSELERENLSDSITNLHDKTNLHDVTKLRTPMIPIDVNVIVETGKVKTELQVKVKRSLVEVIIALRSKKKSTKNI